MQTNLRVNQREKGFMSVYLVFTTFFVLIPMVGLAIDVSIMYEVKAKLQTAVDAAAIGAGVTLQRTTDVTNQAQVNAIKASALKFFNANYPAGYWKTSPLYYDSVPSKDASGAMTIYVHAAKTVPLLFLRVVGLRAATVTAQSTAKIRYVTMMIAVDRSGSVNRAGNASVVQNSLKDFVVNSPTSIPVGQSVFVDGRDYIGLVSFGGNYKLDFAPLIHFNTNAPNINTAINNIDFNNNNSTNTGEGLFQAYHALKGLNQTGSLNVIVLLTDGQPTAFSGEFTATNPANCVAGGIKRGWISTPVGNFTTSGTTSGVFKPLWASVDKDQTVVANNAACAFASNSGNVHNDIPNFPMNAGPVVLPDGITDPGAGNRLHPTTTGYYTGGGNSTSSPQAIRYAAFNVADDIADDIRHDTTLSPLIYVIGLVEPPPEEALNADWLARVANDQSYRTGGGASVYQTGQTSARYYQVSPANLSQAFQQIAAQILRLSQ